MSFFEFLISFSHTFRLGCNTILPPAQIIFLFGVRLARGRHPRAGAVPLRDLRQAGGAPAIFFTGGIACEGLRPIFGVPGLPAARPSMRFGGRIVASPSLNEVQREDRVATQQFSSLAAFMGILTGQF